MRCNRLRFELLVGDLDSAGLARDDDGDPTMMLASLTEMGCLIPSLHPSLLSTGNGDAVRGRPARVAAGRRLQITPVVPYGEGPTHN